jgi:predicted nucleotidyltransferase
LPTRTRSSNSAGAVYLNREERIAALRASALRARARIAAIDRIILFGSLAAGIPTPRSDADLLVIVRESPGEQRSASIPWMLDALSPLPCPVDLVVWTIEEFEQAQRAQQPLAREALEHGIDLLK